MFYHQVVRTTSIPFELKAEISNETTLAALKEAEEIEKGKKKVKSFTDVKDLMEDLEK